MIFGIDEAGRGCVIGPLVMCCAGIEPKKEKELLTLGVKDSKKLSAKQREALYEPVRALCEIRVHYLTAEDITTGMDSLNLNDLEAQTIGKLLSDVPLDSQVFIDSPDNVPIKFAERVKRFLQPAPYLVCENKAEDRYPIVAAASIIAKVTRDTLMTILDRRFPAYGFARHKGYGTKLHKSALEKHGPSPIHRFSSRPVKEVVR